MADAAHAELYAESRRDGKCRRPESGRPVSAHFMISPPLPQSIFSGALRRPLQINQTPIDYLFAFENRNAN